MKLRLLAPALEVPNVLHVVRASCISPSERNVVAMFPEMEHAQEWLKANQEEWTRVHPGSLWIETVTPVDDQAAARGEG